MVSQKLTRLVLLALVSSVMAGVTSCSGNSPTTSTTPAAETASPSSSPTATETPKETNKSSNAQSVEKAITAQLFVPQGIKVSSLDCPNDIPTKEGSTFDCQATAEQGAFKVAVKMENDKGDMHFDTKGLLLLPTLEKVIAEKAKQQSGEAVTVDCDSKTSNIRIFKAIGESFQCDLLKDGKKAAVVTVKVTGEKGEVNFTTDAK